MNTFLNADKMKAGLESGKSVHEFESLYTMVRTREGRMYTDRELTSLPYISRDHPHFKEWNIRRKSAARLTRYLNLRKSAGSILEIGCGNGWLSHRLSLIDGCYVTGLDINQKELDQAERVFGKWPGLQFVCGDIRGGAVRGHQFNTIVFAASIQYFPSCAEILGTALQHLYPGGEIHVLDTIFYKEDGLEQARQRSLAYFDSLQVPAMASYYHHHGLAELDRFKYRILKRPSWWGRRLSGPDPFYWICIPHQMQNAQ
jgi:SAM-dependent methyltransferase